METGEGSSSNKLRVSGFNEYLKLIFALSLTKLFDFITSILSSTFPSDNVSSNITRNFALFSMSGKILGFKILENESVRVAFSKTALVSA